MSSVKDPTGLPGAPRPSPHLAVILILVRREPTCQGPSQTPTSSTCCQLFSIWLELGIDLSFLSGHQHSLNRTMRIGHVKEQLLLIH